MWRWLAVQLKEGSKRRGCCARDALINWPLLRVLQSKCLHTIRPCRGIMDPLMGQRTERGIIINLGNVHETKRTKANSGEVQQWPIVSFQCVLIASLTCWATVTVSCLLRASLSIVTFFRRLADDSGPCWVGVLHFPLSNFPSSSHASFNTNSQTQ